MTVKCVDFSFGEFVVLSFDIVAPQHFTPLMHTLHVQQSPSNSSLGYRDSSALALQS